MDRPRNHDCLPSANAFPAATAKHAGSTSSQAWLQIQNLTNGQRFRTIRIPQKHHGIGIGTNRQGPPHYITSIQAGPMIARNGHALVGEPMVDGAGDDRVQRHYSFLMQVEPGGVKGWRWVASLRVSCAVTFMCAFPFLWIANAALPSFFLSFCLSLVLKTQPNHWTKRMGNTRLATQDPRKCPGPENWG